MSPAATVPLAPCQGTAHPVPLDPHSPPLAEAPGQILKGRRVGLAFEARLVSLHGRRRCPGPPGCVAREVEALPVRVGDRVKLCPALASAR